MHRTFLIYFLLAWPTLGSAGTHVFDLKHCGHAVVLSIPEGFGPYTERDEDHLKRWNRIKGTTGIRSAEFVSERLGAKEQPLVLAVVEGRSFLKHQGRVTRGNFVSLSDHLIRTSKDGMQKTLAREKRKGNKYANLPEVLEKEYRKRFGKQYKIQASDIMILNVRVEKNTITTVTILPIRFDVGLRVHLRAQKFVFLPKLQCLAVIYIEGQAKDISLGLMEEIISETTLQ